MRFIVLLALSLLGLGVGAAVPAQDQPGQDAQQSEFTTTTTPAPAPTTEPAEQAKAPADLATAARDKQEPTLREFVLTAAMLGLAAGAFFFTFTLIEQIKLGHTVSVESHWGGLGGGLGGWRISGPLALLIGSLVFTIAFCTLTLKLIDPGATAVGTEQAAPAESADAAQ